MNAVIITLLGVTCFAIYLVVENVEKRDVMDNNFEEAIKRGIDGVWLFILSFQVRKWDISMFSVVHNCVCSYK